MLIALFRSVSPELANCQLTFVEGQPIDAAVADRQHAGYVETLRRLGAEPMQLPSLPDLPDGVFVEDTAVVLDELAVIARPGAPSRLPEVQSVAAVLASYRPLHHITAPATLDGGDVVRAERTILVGHSSRTNPEGIAQLRGFVEPFGYRVVTVPVTGALHLKSACTYIGRNTLIANPDAMDTTPLAGFDVLVVPAGEGGGAEALAINGTVLVPAAFPQTIALLRDRGFVVEPVDMSELQKAEAGVTCMTILFESQAR